MERLVQGQGSGAGSPFTLAIKSADEALDYVPDMGPLAQRLTRRCWPGPVTLVMEDSHPESLVKQFSPSVRQAVCPAGAIGLRVPAHPIIHDVLRMMAGPIALTSANRRSAPERLDGPGGGAGPGRRRAAGAGRRRQPLRPALERRARPGPEVRNPSRGRGLGPDAQAAGQLHGVVRLHGQHLPQPDGRGDRPASCWPTSSAAGSTNCRTAA